MGSENSSPEIQSPVHESKTYRVESAIGNPSKFNQKNMSNQGDSEEGSILLHLSVDDTEGFRITHFSHRQ
ncbi:hypothetical protein AYI70_g3573 [Smittium culicis]|uniref:Uncharacterized protein n=1 Tax=Smittium culicis TaxID=133412 RepID=A0A1R1Y2S9_9FUNG|nr:hypothetical protein AYI70_g3573 [Smittium culicis]